MGADMYLATAVILSKIMLKSYKSPKELNCLNNDQQIDRYCEFTSANPDYEMLMPIIFNFKHGIELYLKALIMIINPNQEYPVTHDLIFLLNRLIAEIIKLNSQEDVQKDVLDLLDGKMRNTIGKYYFGLYAFSRYKANPDIYNEAERYPEYQNSNCYKIDGLRNKVCKGLIGDIEEDIKNLQKYFREEIFKKISSVNKNYVEKQTS